jgi:hypothetical protein
MIRRLLLFLAAGMCAAAAVCFGVAFVRICRLIFERPDVDRGSAAVAGLLPWVFAFAGFLLTGLLTLWFVRDRPNSNATCSESSQ